MGFIGKLLSKFSKGPAIQNIQNFDMIVEMKDGGVLLPIVTSRHLDNSEEILNLLRAKVNSYLNLIKLDTFKKDYPNQKYIQIEIYCIDKPHQKVLEEIENFKDQYSEQKIKFSWKK